TPPDEARLRPVRAYAARDMLDDGPHLGPRRRLGGPQDRNHRRAAPHMIDMHGGKAALVLACVPERKLLATMRRAECVIDVEDLYFLRLHGGAELIDQRPGQARSLNFARCILQPRNRRLRGKWLPCFWTTANRNLHQRIVPQSVEVIPVLVTAGN